MSMESSTGNPLAIENKMILKFSRDDEICMLEHMFDQEDKTLIEKFPLECDSILSKIKDKNGAIPSTSKKRQRNPEWWECNVRKRLRESGQAYVSINKKKFPARKMKPGCSNCFLKCDTVFSLSDRMQIHQSFWKMPDMEKSNFYFKYVTRNPVKSRKSNSNLKQFSFNYYFEKDTITHRVCRTFFLNTLCIDQKRIYYCFEHLNDANTGVPLPRKKGKNVKKITSLEKLNEVRAHISSFPLIESHHCRAHSQKRYIDGIPNLNKMYSLYSQNNKNPVGIHIYRDIFNKEFNISFFNAKIGQCVKCALFYNEQNILTVNDNYIYEHQSKDQNISLSTAPSVDNQNKTNFEYITDDFICMPEDASYLDDKCSIQKFSLEFASKFEKMKDSDGTISPTTKKRKKNPECWEENVRKRLRESGKAYVSINKKQFPARNIKPPCNNCFFKCENIFSSNDRKKIHQLFWDMSDNEKSNFYFKFVKRHPVKRRKSNSNLKQFSFNYYFEKDTITHRVCRTFFLNTLCIDQKRIYYCFEHLNDANTGMPLPRKKGKNVKKVTPLEKLSEVRVHISSFPSIEFHYCQANFQKKYIDGCLNINKMYSLYTQNNENPVGIHIYREVFNKEFNISFFKHKRDQCDKCIMFANEKNISNTQEKYTYEQHLAEVDALKSDRNNDRLNTDSTMCTICYELQSVFSLPKGNASTFYYKRKLNMYNLTATIVMPNIPTFTYCVLWSEAYSDRSGNDIASALIKILNELIKDYPIIKTLILWSDSYIPVNINRVNSTALKMFIKQNKLNTVLHKFSETGHCVIQEVEYVHGAIDRYLKNIEIHSPLHLIKLLKTMPNKKTKLVVLEMLPDDFRIYSLVANKMDFTKVPFDKIKVLFYDKENELNLYYKFSVRDKEYTIATLIKSGLKNNLKSSSDLLAHRLRTLKPLTIASNKKEDIKELLVFLPHDDRAYFKYLFNI